MAKKISLGDNRFTLRLRGEESQGDSSSPEPRARISDLSDVKRKRRGRLRGPNDGRSKLPAKRAPQRERVSSAGVEEYPRFGNQRYILVATCPNCERRYSRPEIADRFSSDAELLHVRCTDCPNSFGATIVLPGVGSWTLYGPAQIRHSVTQKRVRSYMGFEQHPALLHSLVFNCGGVEEAHTFFEKNFEQNVA